MTTLPHFEQNSLQEPGRIARILTLMNTGRTLGALLHQWRGMMEDIEELKASTHLKPRMAGPGRFGATHSEYAVLNPKVLIQNV